MEPQGVTTATADAPQGQAGVAQMSAITISREYGSGGGEVAKRLAARLGWRLVDHEVVMDVARALGVTEGEAEAHDEHTDTLAARILLSLGVVRSIVPAPLPMQFAMDQPAYDEARRLAVVGALKAGHSVILGRGGQALLADRRDVLHVRIIAPLEQRIQYVMRRERLDHAGAQHRIATKDRDRANFLQAAHRKHPADARLYDLVVNTGVLALDSVVDLVAFALDQKAMRLQTPEAELGPGAGLEPYAEPPGNIAPVAGAGDAAP
jgi:CMP/dCMP kinase